MITVNRITDTLSKARGMPIATIEMHTRVLRKEGVLPETRRGGGATPATTIDAAHILLALMRGSPGAAAENARESGSLVVQFEDLLAPVDERLFAFLGWPQGFTLAQAIAWFIEKFRDGETRKYMADGDWLKVTIDRYWHLAQIEFMPSAELTAEYIEGWRDLAKMYNEDNAERERYMLSDGKLRKPIELQFRSPFLYEAKQAYQSDPARAAEAHRRFREAKELSLKADRWGSEWVTTRTIAPLGALFRSGGGEHA